MVKKLLFLSTIFAIASILNAQNPIINNQFTADPTARVFEGKIYVYPSHDIPSPIERLKEWFCMADYHVFSSENLVDWTDHGVIVSQENVPWVTPESYSMWAPDCVFKDGKYYFYFPSNPKSSNGRGFAIGVAVGDKPYGPFVPQAEPIKGIKGIDPCVFIDKDGQAYIYWSGQGMSMAKLQDNMLELASEPIQIEGLPEGFKEGPFVFERNSKYYYTFPWVQDKTETLAYAMGDSPMGPFEFKGLIMEQWPSECWTNHHSIVEYQNQWYLFYHHNDFSPEFDKNRSTRIDSLFFNSDGTIQKVIPTLRGVGITEAKRQIQIDRYSQVSDNGVTIDFLNKDNKFEGWKTIFNSSGAWLQYNQVNFGDTNLKEVKARVYSPTGGKIQIRLNSLNNPVISEIEIPQNTQWTIINAPLDNLSTGVNDLYLSCNDNGHIEIDWISFE
ncbi:family 43 glycosylhydrolase [Dysgonomonas sp. Marseille-P4677]|uniref:family 43 glycosylhydrolase n=1 Tax=Dysgonomonas sp. Marseille-P4677 TaxID=2364790 RepID=UPI0019144C96|nr:family 43 glycosylhydrolase [Dysgonomonas sp. Marseille-P4677]MBK5722273.1 family 43 glycosylhydrolase [Dysgonomonas sp. Marseille-P4677]